MQTPPLSLFDDVPESPAAPRAATRASRTRARPRTPAVAQLSLFGQDEEKHVAALPEDYHIVDTPEDLERLAAEMASSRRVALDTETTGLDPLTADLVGLSFSTAPGRAHYVPVGHVRGRQIPLADVVRALTPVLADDGITKVGHNLKFDLRVLERAGLALRGSLWDTMIAAQVVDERGGHGLKECARVTLGRAMQDYAALTDRGRRSLAEMDAATVGRYACDDAEATLALSEALAPRLVEEKLDGVFALEMALLPVVAQMESDGVAVDVAYLERLAGDLRAQLAEKAEACYAAAGRRLNLNSPRQIAEVLYDDLALPVTHVTSTGRSTAEAALLELAQVHPLPAHILEYRELSKILTSYALALPRCVSPVTGRIHPTFQQIGARSGRFSCAQPNLQNLPKDAANTVRRAFVAAPGHVLLFADYSQIELRILAHISRDPGLLAAFDRGEDVHARTAAEVLGVALDQVTPEQRRLAKGINFGLVYGMSPQGLAAQLGVTVAEAERYVDTYFARYAGVKRYMAETLRAARSLGYVTTMMGRRRHVEGLQAPDARVRGQAERQAINAPIQGSAADVIKRAMVEVAARLPAFGARLVLQVHDELVIEVPEENAAALREVVVAVMEAPPHADFRVPLRVEAHISPVWN